MLRLADDTESGAHVSFAALPYGGSALPPSSPRACLVGSVLIGADAFVAAWVHSLVPQAGTVNVAALGVVRRGRLVAGCVYQNFRTIDIDVVMAADSPSWALPDTLRALFGYPFLQLGVVRLTAIIGRANKRSRRLAEGLGFRLEGRARRALDGREDAMIYGMLREECRFLQRGRT
jgi:hypothetical protein